ncbi:MAG: ABC transporter permease [Lachnospiraceae bacterium]|nr:ABC transporter permease [Lachnospiraceae bacterium]
MSILKRAFFYVSRKWQQSLIVFFVLIIVCTSAFIGFAILKASDSAAANLRRQFGGTFSMEIDKSNPANMQNSMSTDQYTSSYYVGEYLDHDVIDEVMKTAGILEYTANSESVANLKSGHGTYYDLIENKQNYGSLYNTRIAHIEGWTSLSQCPYFANRFLEVTQGEMFTADGEGKAVISRELAELNHLKLGDMLTLEINGEVTGFDIPLEKQTCEVEIIGIFDICGNQKVDQFTSPRQMLQNWVFVSAKTLLSYENDMSKSIGLQPIGYSKVTFSVNDPAEMDHIIKKLQQNKAINWDCFKIQIDNGNYENVERALKRMDGGIYIMIFAITVAGVGVLILLLSIWAKSRIYETGILLSVGKSNWEILTQRMIEIILITVLAFGISYGMGNIMANDVGNILLRQANEQNFEETEENSIHAEMPVSADNFNLDPVFAAPKVEELIVNISVDIFVGVCVLELFIVFSSICIASIPVMSMKPRAILTRCE